VALTHDSTARQLLSRVRRRPRAAPVAGHRRPRARLSRGAGHGQGRARTDGRLRPRDHAPSCTPPRRARRSVEWRPAGVHAPGGREPRRVLPQVERRRSAHPAARHLARRARGEARRACPAANPRAIGRSARGLRREPERQGGRRPDRSAHRPCRRD
jgi:hypothetical protein